MSLTAHANPLDGLFWPSRRLTDYSGDPEFPIPPRTLPPGYCPDAVARALARLERKT